MLMSSKVDKLVFILIENFFFYGFLSLFLLEFYMIVGIYFF